MHCPGGNATEPIWRVLASSLGISSWTPLKPQHSIPCWLSVEWEPSACRSCQCSTMWVGRQSRRVCFGAKPDKGFLDMKSRRIRKWYGDANESWRRDPAEGSWRLDSREASSRELAAGQRERQAAESWRLDSREARQHGIGSSESESRWVWFQ